VQHAALFMPINLLDVRKHAAEREKRDRKHVNSASIKPCFQRREW
jgi:hypothetical protein